MRRKYRALLVVLLAYVGGVNAQAIFEDYQDGKIWFKLNNNESVESFINTNPRDLDLNVLAFLPALKEKYEITRLSRPFVAPNTSIELERTFLVEFNNAGSVLSFVEDLEKQEIIEYAERVPLDRPCLTPNDSKYGSQWHLPKIKANGAWNYFSTGSKIVIAIVDDAMQTTHPDLSPNLWVNPGEIPGNGQDDDLNGYIDDVNGFDIADYDNNPNPPNNNFDHGTHVTGISSAATNNSTGVASIGYSAKLMCVKSTNNATYISHGYDGVFYAASNGADVINMSWGGNASSSTGQNTMTYAHNQGCVLVAGAGNNGNSTKFYPAAYSYVISVAGTKSDDKKVSSSCYGTWVDICAPGNNIYSTTINSGYGYKTGTSMASPLVAGLCALMRSADTTLTAAQIESCLTSSAVNINSLNPGFSGWLGAGRIDAEAAMICINNLILSSNGDIDALGNREKILPLYNNISKQLNVSINATELGSLAIYNLLGARIYSQQSKPENDKVNIGFNFSSYPAGVYFVQWTEGNEVTTKKLMIY